MNTVARASFHEGERTLQKRAGSHDMLAEVGPHVIREFMPQQHRDFFSLLPFIVIGAVDAGGQPWASVIAGPAGFVASPRDDLLQIAALPLAQDPVAASMVPGQRVGLLGIQPHTRRRNRANGRIDIVDASGFTVHVEQSFGNCPKYIQAREVAYVPDTARVSTRESMTGLDAQARQFIAAADTFFIATAHPQSQGSDDPAHGVDVSHRGGKPGFVHVDASGSVLTVPDFTGNAFFNTLGNLLVNPRCGLVFIDYATGDLLHVAARGEIVTDPQAVDAFAGAQRLVRLHVEAVVRRRRAVALKWGAATLSPHLAPTGNWGASAQS
ncbi:pyridoxamine 5'-phosphate oxidase family protein [Caenimonas koreensis]|uniref:pyridoxamine 5'-phosphate oxidase family protein n=1 Tax=Caenimonas koreensis TaxID=367474 RepID=UPI001298DDE6|nr:pyridoxamine 5'-phosphate oxidase family protein [Caenimonas koreensis]